MLQSKKHRVREIVVSALRGQSGNTDFEATSTLLLSCIQICFGARELK
jgi:hypothetical protein